MIGTESDPFKYTATVNLHGDRDSETFVMDGAMLAGNKVLVNVGLMEFYGVHR